MIVMPDFGYLSRSYRYPMNGIKKSGKGKIITLRSRSVAIAALARRRLRTLAKRVRDIKTLFFLSRKLLTKKGPGESPRAFRFKVYVSSFELISTTTEADSELPAAACWPGPAWRYPPAAVSGPWLALLFPMQNPHP